MILVFYALIDNVLDGYASVNDLCMHPYMVTKYPISGTLPCI